MGMVVRSNIMAVNAQRQLGVNNSQVSKALEKLASGYRINRAGDDASGLAISEKMKAQIKGLDTASLNAQDGVSVVQTAEGALTEVHNMLNRMVELATRAANGINNTENRQQLQEEINQLNEEIDRIADSTDFNGIKLLNGTGDDTSADGITVADQPNSTAYTGFVDGVAGTTNASVSFSLAGMSTKGAGNLDFTVGGKTYTISAEETDDDASLTDKLVAALNADKITDTAAGDFTASKEADGSIKLTSANQAAMTDNSIFTGNFSVAPATVNPAGRAAGDFSAGDEFAFDFSGITTLPNANETIELLGQTFTFVANGTTPTGNQVEIGNDITGTISNLIDTIAADATIGASFAVTKDGTTMKMEALADGLAAAAPALSGSWTAGAAVLPTHTPKDAGNAGDEGGAGTLTLQIGDTNDEYNKLTITFKSMKAGALGVNTIDLAGDAGGAIQMIKTAIDSVSSYRAELGAIQNRLEYAINNLDTTSENIQAANSRIRDTDMAKMMMEYTKVNVVTQSAQAMLAQANQQPQSILQLLQ